MAETLVDAENDKIAGWKPPLEWLEILFQSKPLPPGCGLYIAYPDHGGLIPTTRKLFRLAALSGPGKELYGLRTWWFEQEILLLMDDPLRYAPAEFLYVHAYQRADYRPAALAYVDKVKTKALVFDWQSGPGSKPFEVIMLKVGGDAAS